MLFKSICYFYIKYLRVTQTVFWCVREENKTWLFGYYIHRFPYYHNHSTKRNRLSQWLNIKDTDLSLYIVFFLFVFLAALGLCCCSRAFSSCSEWGLLSSCGAWASHCSGFSWCREQALGHRGSAVVANGTSWPVACGICPYQG